MSQPIERHAIAMLGTKHTRMSTLYALRTARERFWYPETQSENWDVLKALGT